MRYFSYSSFSDPSITIGILNFKSVIFVRLILQYHIVCLFIHSLLAWIQNAAIALDVLYTSSFTTQRSLNQTWILVGLCCSFSW